jgi:hypothetical protein
VPWTVYLPTPLANFTAGNSLEVDPDATEGTLPLESGHPLGLRQLSNPRDLDQIFEHVTPSTPNNHCEFNDPAFERRYIDTFRLVSPMGRSQFRCHRYLGPVLQRIWTAIAAVVVTYNVVYPIRSIGCYNPRYQRVGRVGATSPWYGLSCKYVAQPPRQVLSVHAWGAALDINEDTNRMGSGRGNIPTPFINIFESNGFLWGGRFRGAANDPMHFEWALPQIPAQ